MQKPRLTLYFLAFFLVTNMITMFFKDLRPYILIYPYNLSQPLTWYKFLTYPLFGAGLLNWFKLVFLMLIPGFIVEKYLSLKSIAILVLSVLIFVGFLFMYLHRHDDFDPALYSPSFIGWAFVAAGLVLGLRNYRRLVSAEKIMLLLCALLSILLVFPGERWYTEALAGTTLAALLTWAISNKA